MKVLLLGVENPMANVDYNFSNENVLLALTQKIGNVFVWIWGKCAKARLSFSFSVAPLDSCLLPFPIPLCKISMRQIIP